MASWEGRVCPCYSCCDIGASCSNSATRSCSDPPRVKKSEEKEKKRGRRREGDGERDIEKEREREGYGESVCVQLKCTETNKVPCCSSCHEHIVGGCEERDKTSLSPPYVTRISVQNLPFDYRPGSRCLLGFLIW